MIRTIIFHHLLDLNDLPAAERWFYRYHIPEVLRSRPLSYLSYRAVPPPPGAEDYGLFNYKIHENVHAPEGETKLAHLSMTPEVVPLRVIMVNVPVAPTEDFLGSDLALDDKTILRWITVFRYPEGVSVEKGDNWYINVHAPHVMRQPGLTRFFSYRVLPSAVPVRKGASKFLHPGSEVSSNWHRVSEMWFENSNGWVGLLQAGLGDPRRLPVLRAGRRLREHVHPRAADRRLGEGDHAGLPVASVDLVSARRAARPAD
jgi:hypothetical protein